MVHALKTCKLFWTLVSLDSKISPASTPELGKKYCFSQRFSNIDSACLIIQGKIVASQGGKQEIEVQASEAELHGKCVPGSFLLFSSNKNYRRLSSCQKEART